MGLFNKNMIKVKKEIKGDLVQILVNYFSLKDPNEFRINLLKDLIGDNLCLAVIDTRFILNNSSSRIEEDVNDLIKLLDEKIISYSMLTDNYEANRTFMGFHVKLNNNRKTKSYKIGLVISSENFEKIGDVVNKFSGIYYISLEDQHSEGLIDKFNAARGEIEDLSEIFKYNIYNDNYVCQIRIFSDDKKAEFVEDVLKRTYR